MSDHTTMGSATGTVAPAQPGSVAHDVANALSNRTRRLSVPPRSDNGPLAPPVTPDAPITPAGVSEFTAGPEVVPALAGVTPPLIPNGSPAVATADVGPGYNPADTVAMAPPAAAAMAAPVQAYPAGYPPFEPPQPAPTPSTGHLGSVTSLALTPSEPVAAPAKPARRRAPRQTRKARLRISRIDPWSVMKTALLFGVAGWIIFVVAVWVVFTVLDMTGIYSAINDTVSQVFSSPTSGSPFNIKDYVNTTRATALAALVGAVNVILLTALATIFAFLYNLSANVMGGIEVTLAED